MTTPKPTHEEKASAHYVEVLRRMTPEQKLATAEELWRTAWELKAAGERMLYPDLSEEQIHKRVRRIFLRAST